MNPDLSFSAHSVPGIRGRDSDRPRRENGCLRRHHNGKVPPHVASCSAICDALVGNYPISVLAHSMQHSIGWHRLDSPVRIRGRSTCLPPNPSNHYETLFFNNRSGYFHVSCFLHFRSKRPNWNSIGRAGRCRCRWHHWTPEWPWLGGCSHWRHFGGYWRQRSGGISRSAEPALLQVSC